MRLKDASQTNVGVPILALFGEERMRRVTCNVANAAVRRDDGRNKSCQDATSQRTAVHEKEVAATEEKQGFLKLHTTEPIDDARIHTQKINAAAYVTETAALVTALYQRRPHRHHPAKILRTLLDLSICLV
ncbi:unnamed protein product [Peronospora belbahrii]|uniref:Uncharacterized protein n=1 Tax=Peronospora belbahrii TaxID=622444 RepID=A0ABN8D243_9STRA|nr:unnamed protein product [Peronospora belbahrii]